jgi:hypothetical protein
LLALLIGCGGSSKPTSDGAAGRTGDGATDDASGTDPGNPPASAGLACQALNEAAAQLGARCTGGSLADWRAYQASSTDCAAYDRHVAEGTVEYHPELFAACLQKFQASCDEPGPYPCQYEVLLGKVADGQPCRDFEVCGRVSGCGNLGGALCGDICLRFGNENEPCGIHCGPGPVCLDGSLCTTGLYCSNGICVKSKTVGEACGGADQVACSDPLFCNRADPTDPVSAGTCARRMASGRCDDDSACPPTQFCRTGTCVARRPAGATCADASGACEQWTSCDELGSSICVPAGRTSQPCATFPGNALATTCIAGVCDGMACQPQSFAGGTCAIASCVQGTFCDPTSQTCVSCDAVDGGAPRSDGGGSDAAVCSDLQLMGNTVTEVERNGTSPSATGGTVTDGTYVLTSYEIYPPGSANVPRQRRMTLGIAGTQLDLVSETSDAPGVTLNASGTFTTNGINATIAYSCGAAGSFPLAYSATGTSLVLIDGFNVETFARQP